MIYRIIDKETKLFKRDDSVWDNETEEAILTPCPQGFSIPKWVADENAENEQGVWIEGA